MSEFVESELPGIESDHDTVFLPAPTGGGDDAPWGRKADGTPRAKPGRKSGSSGRSSTPRKTNAQKLANLESEIADKLVEASLPLAVVSPLMAAVIDQRAERTAKNLVTIAGRSERFMRALENAITYGAYFELAATMGAITVAGMVEFGWMHPDSMAAQKLRVTDEWIVLYGQDGSEIGGTNQGGFVVSPNGHVESRSQFHGTN